MGQSLLVTTGEVEERLHYVAYPQNAYSKFNLILPASVS
jgi:hypothetical protein